MKSIKEVKNEYARTLNNGHGGKFKDWDQFSRSAYIDNEDIEKIAMLYAQSQTQELTEWKDSMMKVHNELDLQGIAKSLGLPLGSSIAPQVLPKIIGLIEQNAEVVEMLEAVADAIELGGYVPVEYIRERLTKYNHLNKKP